MTKWIVGILLLVNLALFGWMRWGGMLVADGDTTVVQAALNSDKIKLLELSPASAAAPVSGMTPGVSLVLSPVSAPAASIAPAVAVRVTPMVKEQPKTRGCAEWGEFSGSDLSRAQQSLAAFKLGERLTQRGVEHDHGYWVYIPPLKRRADVEKKIGQLKERGVKDYFVVQEEGKWLNAISLGVFKTEEAANKYLALLRTQDVHSAKVSERASKLKYTVFALKGLDADMLDKIGALQKEFPDSEFRVSACGN